MQFVDDAVSPISESIGLPLDQMKYLLAMLVAIPLAFVYRSLPTIPTLRHIYSIFWGLVLCIACLGPLSWIHAFGTSTVCYLILMFGNRKHASTLVFVWMIAYMSGTHLYRQYTDYMGWTLDFSGPQMLLTISMTSFAYNVSDGWKAKSEGIDAVNPKYRRYMLTEMPSLLEFYGFVFYFGSFLAGPSWHLKSYLDISNGTMFNDKCCKGKMPSTLLPALKILYVNFMCPLFRAKYYFGWCLSEAALVAAGAGYNGFSVEEDGSMTPKWDRVTNAYPTKVELAENVRSVAANWNICVANWLNLYVYTRVSHWGTGMATVFTYSMSAFWHGFYPGYYFFFLYSAVFTILGRFARRTFRPYFVSVDPATKEETHHPLKPAYDIIGVVVTMTLLNYCGASFIVLGWDRSLIYFNAVFWWGHIVCGVAFVAFSLSSGRKRNPKQKKSS